VKKVLILPAYNEEKHIRDVVLRGKKYVDAVLVIDNCSMDRTYEEAKNAGAIVFKHCVNLGKAGSLKTGCEAALKMGADIIAFMDSDGQHKPEDLPEFFKAIEQDNYQIVIGSRKRDENMPLIRRLGTALLMYATKILFKVDVEDIQSGFRVFKSDIYEKIKWTSTGSSHYFADAEITVRMGSHSLKYKEIPIETIYFDQHKGMHALQGLNLLFKIITWRFLL
jgi:glycosyltransferase involved in cell wall biosynthesis